MRRADRLFQIVEFLSSRRQAVTADVIAKEFGICKRTVYRDVQDLVLSGVPINGEAGVGYMLDRDYRLKPIMFDVAELEALILGASMVCGWTDEKFAKDAIKAVQKIYNVLPGGLRDEMAKTALFAPQKTNKVPWTVDFTAIRHAIRAKNKVHFKYKREDGQGSQRTIRPLALTFFSPVWLLSGWCEKRDDFRHFRLDRMEEMDVLKERFRDEKGKTLKDLHEKECGTGGFRIMK